MTNGTTTRSPFFKSRHRAADFDDDAHRLMPKDVAVFHRRLVAIEEVQVRAANCGRGDFDDRVRRFLNGWIGNCIDAHVMFAVPAECSHRIVFSEFVG